MGLGQGFGPWVLCRFRASELRFLQASTLELLGIRSSRFSAGALLACKVYADVLLRVLWDFMLEAPDVYGLKSRAFRMVRANLILAWSLLVWSQENQG